MDSNQVVQKLKELYPFLVSEDIVVSAIRKDEQWLIFFRKEGHEEAFALPGDFFLACVERGYCALYRVECTQALGRLMEAVRSHKASAEAVVAKMKRLVAELNNPAIIIAVSEDEPAWSFFLTKTGVSRPVEYKLPMEVIERCIYQDECSELEKATLVAYQCLMGD